MLTKQSAVTSYKYAMTVVALSLLVLTGCNKAQKSTEQSSSATTPAVTEATAQPAPNPPEATKEQSTPQESPSTERSQNFTALMDVISNTQKAVEANDFAKARTEFEKFEDFWSKVEDGVKAKAPNTYNSIEDNADALKNQLKASNKAKSLSSLKKLQTSLISVANS